jgi:hypothetical protein
MQLPSCLFYIRLSAHRAVNTPLRLYKTSRLILCKAEVAVRSEIHTQHINAVGAPGRIFGR